jgi:hypothetical protein
VAEPIPPPIDTPAKVKAAREALGLSLSDMAIRLRLAGSLDNARTFVREMEEGRRPISGPIQVALEGMLRPDPPRVDVRAMAAIVHAAGGRVDVKPSTLELLPRLTLHRRDDDRTGSIVYEVRPF